MENQGTEDRIIKEGKMRSAGSRAEILIGRGYITLV